LPRIDHVHIAMFADTSVNRPTDKAEAGRERVNNLRALLERYTNVSPDFSFVEVLHAGSVAKGTELRTHHGLGHRRSRC
jgi:hypothetical protein